MTSPDVYDVIVVGAGVEGSATAYNLAKANYKTLLLDQFALPHTRGSSHGQSRIIRKAYNAQHYARMMPTAYDMWQELEHEESTWILRQTGLLVFCEPPHQYVTSCIRSLENIGAVHEVMDARTINNRMPMFRLGTGYEGVYEEGAGMLRADRALVSLWNQFRKHGGTIRDGEEVTHIEPGKPVTVTTRAGSYRGNSTVLCLGPWTSKIIKPLGLHLPLKPVRVSVLYWKANAPILKDMPCFVGIFGDYDLYGMPCFEYPEHVKICFHGGPDIDPDMRDSEKAVSESNDNITHMKAIVQKYFQHIEADPSIRETCIYTMTPDEDFILDTHPHYRNIVLGAGFSGHGFKLAPVVGKILAELATGRRPSFDLSPFRINRFKNSKL